MPGHTSSQKRTAKFKRKGGGHDISSVDIPTVLDVRVGEITDAPDWQSVVSILCHLFDLPGASLFVW